MSFFQALHYSQRARDESDSNLVLCKSAQCRMPPQMTLLSLICYATIVTELLSVKVNVAIQERYSGDILLHLDKEVQD